MGSEPTIIIKTNGRFRPWPAIYFALAQVGVIGIGIVSDSAAMQWSGFVMLGIILLAAAISANEKRKGLTIAEARAVIDEIESRERRRLDAD